MADAEQHALPELRVARDGELYSYAQFEAWYGKAADQCWAEADPCWAHTASMRTAVRADGAAQPVGTTVLLSWEDLEAMTHTPGWGGVRAHSEQRRFRKCCMNEKKWELDLSDTTAYPTYDWKQLLKGLPKARSDLLVGQGIVKFTFRLLQNARDHNYVGRDKEDTGERHIFLITCADGVRWHLHFHKDGKMDPPIRILPNAPMPQDVLPYPPMNDACCSAEQSAPTWTAEHILDATPCERITNDDGTTYVRVMDNIPIGGKEANMALRALLRRHPSQKPPFAVDITATTAFPWHRWLRNVKPEVARELIRGGITRVLALCSPSLATESIDEAIVFCHPDGQYTRVIPGTSAPGHMLVDDWTNCPTFRSAPVQTDSWMRPQPVQAGQLRSPSL